MIGAPSPKGATGYFRLEKLGSRWLFVSPAGNYLWLKSVQSIGPYDGGTVEINNVNTKYANNIQTWGNQANRRLTSWGFNALGEYSSTYVLPDGLYGAATGSTVPHPYIRLVKPSSRSSDNRYPYLVADIVTGMSAHYTGFRGHLPDVFDPSYADCVTDTVNEDNNTLGLNASQYLIGTSSDDLDELFGFGGGPNAVDTTWRHPELGYMVAITDPTTYTKQAWVSYLTQKYGTIAALNTAWSATYTTFTDVLNETGLVHAWIGDDDFTLSNTNANCKIDMKAFTGIFADKYFSLVATAIRAKTPNHLVFSPDAIGASARPQILAAAAKWCDAVQVTNWYAGPSTLLQQAYTNMAVDKPMFAYILTTACADSPYALSCTQGSSDTNYATQAARATAHANFIASLWSFTTSGSSINPMVGFNMWEWTDKTEGGEAAPFGLVTVKDNAYDGVEARIATGTDAWGYHTGGEAANYGNFLGPVTTSNNTIDSNILALFSVAPPPPPTDPPAIPTFTATPSSINAGQSSTLTWVVQNATTAYISNIGTVALTGSRTLFPTVSTSYTLTATGAGGTTSAIVTVKVAKKHGRH